MDMVLHFPVFVIASADGVVVVKADGNECIMLFHRRQMAEEQIATIQSRHRHLGTLRALSVPDAGALRDGLSELPGSVTCAVWDPTGKSAGFQHVGLDELLRAVSSV